uniref:Putative heat shock 70 kDa protein 4 n=1 Tax=Corethrella appendiculata TaxID=1370023 RepID=U5EM97_9DIPT
MSVIGIDFGNESCYVAVAKAGGIETIANDYSLRATPSCVAFAGKNRILGVAAKNQLVTNMNNTVFGFKRLLGRKYNDPHVQHELRQIPYKVEQHPAGGVGIRVNYLDEEHIFSPEQITAMLFTKLKEDSAKELKTQINDCVISVPSYFTNAERKALLDAASISGLHCLRLMNETTATALSYGFYKQDLPGPDDKPRNVIFVDFGHSSLQVSACAFHKSKLKVLATCSDQIGGRDIDSTLANYFSDEFQKNYKIDPRTNKRAYIRLLAEVEKIKKQMSANSTKLPLNIECFMNDIDVHSYMQRQLMEELCSDVFKRVENTMRKLLQDSKLTLDDIHSVEIVGGSSRIPAIKHSIEEIFGKQPSTTLNQDEAVSRGAALQCAIMSPAVRVRDFSCVDTQCYPVSISWDGDQGSPKSEIEVFPQYHQAPFSRLLTIYRRQPFNVSIAYNSDSVPYPDKFIGEWRINGVKSNANGDPQEIKIKVRLNANGIISISSAQMVEKKDSIEEAPNSPTTNGEQTQNNSDSQATNENENSATSVAEQMEVSEDTKDKKKKVSSKIIDLTWDCVTHGYSDNELSNYFEQECKMISNDRREKERVDARNALEEFIYDMRGKIQEGGELADYVSENDREQICQQLEDLENWIYEDGENCEREVYKTKLNELQTKTDPIKQRYYEYEGLPQAFNDLGHAINMAFKAVEQYRAGEPKYEHLTEAEMINITETADKTRKWYEDSRGKLAGLSKTHDPPIKIADIRHEWQTLTTCTNSVINRPKPKPPTPPASNTTSNNDQQQHQNENTNGNAQNNSETESNNSNKKDTLEDKMDVE